MRQPSRPESFKQPESGSHPESLQNRDRATALIPFWHSAGQIESTLLRPVLLNLGQGLLEMKQLSRSARAGHPSRKKRKAPVFRGLLQAGVAEAITGRCVVGSDEAVLPGVGEAVMSS
jgi:hypothetical protein